MPRHRTQAERLAILQEVGALPTDMAKRTNPTASRIAMDIRANADDYHAGRMTDDEFKARNVALWTEARECGLTDAVTAALYVPIGTLKRRPA